MMTKRIALVLTLAVVLAGMVFPQSDFDNAGAMNAVGLDIGPIIVGSFISNILKQAADGNDSIKGWGFGIAMQYERQIVPHFTGGIKMGYLGFGIGVSAKDGSGQSATLEMKLHSFTAEAHARFYPADVFFIDGMLGYGLISPVFSGKAVVNEDGDKVAKSASFSVTRHYFTYGMKFGWRTGGGEGGFYFEPSFGYYGQVGIGDTIETRIAKKLDAESSGEYDAFMELLERYVFIGGVRLAFVFGWKF
jgi:hypothetical protein